jgi:DNA polymerase-3 subunit gamma/tau
VTTEALVQAWPAVLDAVKAKGRVAAIVIGNASLVSLDEAVLTLRFPRQGDVKGFVNSRYEDLLKQVITTMFGINIVVRAVTGGDTPPPSGRRPGPSPVPPAPFSAPEAAPSAPAAPPAQEPGPARPTPTEPPAAESAPAPAAAASGADLPPPPSAPDDEEEDFDLDDEDMSAAMANDLSGMALVQRELGGQVIAEYTD